MRKILLSAALALVASLAASAAPAQVFLLTFVNHTNAQAHFYVDDEYACAANAGMNCYSHMATGPRRFRATIGAQTIAENAGALCCKRHDIIGSERHHTGNLKCMLSYWRGSRKCMLWDDERMNSYMTDKEGRYYHQRPRSSHNYNLQNHPTIERSGQNPRHAFRQ